MNTKKENDHRNFEILDYDNEKGAISFNWEGFYFIVKFTREGCDAYNETLYLSPDGIECEEYEELELILDHRIIRFGEKCASRAAGIMYDNDIDYDNERKN